MLDGPHNHGQPLYLSELAHLIRMGCFFWIFVPHTSRCFFSLLIIRVLPFVFQVFPVNLQLDLIIPLTTTFHVHPSIAPLHPNAVIFSIRFTILLSSVSLSYCFLVSIPTVCPSLPSC